MSRPWSLLLALVAPCAAGCAFLLDFDELQGGGEKAGDAGTSGEAGTDGPGSAPCPDACDDRDPCTADACASSGCKHEYATGIVPDGLADTLTADHFHRVTMTAREDHFYLSAFESVGPSYEVILRAFTHDETALGVGAELSPLANFGGIPVSAMALAPRPASSEIVGYVAIGTAPNLPARVWRLTFDAATMQYRNGTAQAVSVDPNYVGGEWTHPVVWSPGGGSLYGAWPGVTSGVYLHSGTTVLGPGSGPQLDAGGKQVFSLAPLAAGTTPGVLFVSDGPYVQAPSQVAFPLGQCDTGAGAFLSAASGFTGIEGLWIGGWTKVVTGGVLSEQLPVVCATPMRGPPPVCVGALKCGSGEQLLSGVRNAAFTFMSRPQDPAGTVFEILSLPFVDPVKGQTGIGLDLYRIDLDVSRLDGGVRTERLTPETIPLSAQSVGTNGAGPDRPALAFSPPDRLGIAWIEPAMAGTGDELHVQRHRLCLPR